MCPGGMEAGIATGADMDHGRHLELDHLFVERIPGAVGQRRRGPVTTRRIGVQIDTDEAVLEHAFLQLGNRGSDIRTR